MAATFAMSGQYGLFGTQWIAFNSEPTTDGLARLVHQVGGARLSSLPERYINAGLMLRLVKDSGKRTAMNVVADSIIHGQTHEWKKELSLEDMATKFGCPEVASKLRVYYADAS